MKISFKIIFLFLTFVFLNDSYLYANSIYFDEGEKLLKKRF